MYNKGKWPIEGAVCTNQTDGGAVLHLLADALPGNARTSVSNLPPPLLLKPPAIDEFTRRVAASIGGQNSHILSAALAANSTNVANFEASVRTLPGQLPIAGRMMIEKTSWEVLAAIAQSLDVVLPRAAALWLDLAQGEGVPIIAGWDLRGGGDQRCVKLYVNASDAWRGTGARLRNALAPGLAGTEPPAVIGMNVRADGIIEVKLYVQSAEAVELARGLGPHARAIADAARREEADAGGVLSFDVSNGTLRERAFFVALKEPSDGKIWQCIRDLPGCSAETIEPLLPFAPAPPRSMGVSLSDGAWTLYFKPRDSCRAREALEPMAIFRAGDVEVGVFVEPNERAARAFCRTEYHAVIVRVRHGVLPPLIIESLVQWFATQLRVAEQAGACPATPMIHPPAPWRFVEHTESSGGMREPS